MRMKNIFDKAEEADAKKKEEELMWRMSYNDVEELEEIVMKKAMKKATKKLAMKKKWWADFVARDFEILRLLRCHWDIEVYRGPVM